VAVGATGDTDGVTGAGVTGEVPAVAGPPLPPCGVEDGVAVGVTTGAIGVDTGGATIGAGDEPAPVGAAAPAPIIRFSL
jgi:hypothetical protein